MNLKAQGLLYGAAFVRERFGEGAFERVLAATRPELRLRERLAIATPHDWIPQAELSDFLGAAERTLGTGDGKMAQTLGAAAAHANLRHMTLRLAFFLARPEFVMRRVAGVWREFNDEGEMLVRSFDEGRMSAELVGMSEPDAWICDSVTGWLVTAGEATGMESIVAEHVECRARAAARCLWVLAWERPKR